MYRYIYIYTYVFIILLVLYCRLMLYKSGSHELRTSCFLGICKWHCYWWTDGCQVLLLLSSLRAISLDDSSAKNLMLQQKQTYTTLYHFSTRAVQVCAWLFHFEFQRGDGRKKKGKREGKTQRKKRKNEQNEQCQNEKGLKQTWFVKSKTGGGWWWARRSLLKHTTLKPSKPTGWRNWQISGWGSLDKLFKVWRRRWAMLGTDGTRIGPLYIGIRLIYCLRLRLILFRTSSPKPTPTWAYLLKVSSQCIDFTLPRGQPIHGARRYSEWGEASSLIARPESGRQQLTIVDHESKSLKWMVGLSEDWVWVRGWWVPPVFSCICGIVKLSSSSLQGTNGTAIAPEFLISLRVLVVSLLLFYGHSLGGLHATVVPHIFHVTDLFCTVICL